MTKVLVEVDDEVLDEVIRKELIESYECSVSVEGRNGKYSKALRRVVKYFSDPDQWKEFKKNDDLTPDCGSWEEQTKFFV